MGSLGTKATVGARKERSSEKSEANLGAFRESFDQEEVVSTQPLWAI